MSYGTRSYGVEPYAGGGGGSSAAATYDALVSALSPVGRWKLDDTSGTSAAAAAGSAGTYAGSPTLAATGLVTDGGTAVTMDGNTQEVTFPTSGLGLGTPGSILFTFTTTDTTGVELFRDNTSAGGSGTYISLSGATVTTRINGSTRTNTGVATSTYTNGATHQMLLTTSGTTATLYCDGVQVDQWARVAAFSTLVTPLHFGRNGTATGTSSYFAVTYDDIAIFTTELTSTDAAAIWAAATGAAPLTVTVDDARGLTDAITMSVGATYDDDRGLTDTSVAAVAAVTTDDRGLTDTAGVALTVAGSIAATDDRGLSDGTAAATAASTTDDRGLADSTALVLALVLATSVTDDRGLTDSSTPVVSIPAVVTSADDRGLTDAVVLDLVKAPYTLRQFGLGGRRRLGTGMVTFAPAVVARPVSVPETAQYIVARAIHTVTGVGPARTYNHQEEKRPRSRHRITVNHKDVTYFRGAETPEPTWSYITPGLYGPGSIVFPQIRSDERVGYGDLDWISKWAPVHVERINAAGTRTTSYRGMLSDYDLDGPDFASTLAGELTGRASTAYRPPPIYRRMYDIGGMVKQMVRERLLLSAKGPDMGIIIAETGGRSQMDWLSEVMALSQLRDGTQWTLMPQEDDRAYHLVQKDTTTIHYTLYLDDATTVPHLRRDFMDEPNQEYADSVRPDGLRVRFATYPGMQFAARPAYPLAGGASMPPGTVDADTVSGAGVNTLIWRLFILGFLDTKRDLYDSETADGVRRAQRRAGLLDGPVDGVTTIPGTVNPLTWKALWSLAATGASLRGAHIRPAAQQSRTMKYRLNATGQRVAYNPNYDPHVQKVAQATTMGAGRSRSQTEHWAERELHDGNTPNWVGTIDVTMGAVISGEHNPGDAFDPSMLIDARGVKPNRNVWVPRFDGGTLFHISATSKGDDRAVTLTVDTRARDSMKVWEVIDRNREARTDPSRNFINANLSSRQTLDSITPWDDVGGLIDYQVVVPASTWTVFEVVAGQEGQIRDFDIQTVNAPAEFTVAVFGRDIDPRRLQQLIGNPLTDDGRRNWRRHHKQLTENHLLLYAAGVQDNPCGYHPTTKPDAPLDFPAIPPADVISGRFKDEAGFPYFCFAEPVVRVAIYADRYTFIDPGRLFRVQENDQSG